MQEKRLKNMGKKEFWEKSDKRVYIWKKTAVESVLKEVIGCLRCKRKNVEKNLELLIVLGILMSYRI